MTQKVTNHAWHNRGGEPCLLGVRSFAGVRAES
jgi:hypothetical protein